MLDCATSARRVVAATLGCAAVAAAMLFGATPSALANEDPNADPPGCSAADLEGVKSNVSASTSVYLFTHPDVNYFFTSLEGVPTAGVNSQVKAYLASHPTEQAELAAVRQPLVDIKERCGAPPTP